MTEKIINVLYVDDEAVNLLAFESSFRRYFNVFTAISAKEANKILAKNVIHVLITDQRMPETKGTELLADAVAKYPVQSRILLTAYADIDAVIDAINKGQVFKYLTKPWNDELLKECIKIGYELFLKKVMVRQDELQYNNFIPKKYKIVNKKRRKR